MLKAEQATPHQIAIAKWQRDRERRAHERQAQCVLVECDECRSTLSAEDLQTAYLNLETHKQRAHRKETV
jgi:hypothetical protein